LAKNHIDSEKWSPLIYNFRHYFRLADKELGKTFRAEKITLVSGSSQEFPTCE
jgi:hypothetical protein